jgi:hypothetical protein
VEDLSIATVVTIVVGVALAFVVLLALARTVRIVPQATRRPTS